MKTVLEILRGVLVGLGVLRAVVPSVPVIPVPKKGPKVAPLD